MFRSLVDSFIFKNISEERLKKDFSEIEYEIKNYSKNNFIMYRNDICNKLGILIQGKVKTEMQDASGNIIPFEEFLPISVFAPAFLFGRINKYPVDVIAEKDNTKVLFLPKKSVIHLMHINTDFMINYLNAVCNKAHFLSQKIGFSFFYKTISQKLAKYLLDKLPDNSCYITINENIQDIADFFDITRPSLSRTLNTFIKEGIIIKEKRKLFKVLDYNKLINKLN